VVFAATPITTTTQKFHSLWVSGSMLWSLTRKPANGRMISEGIGRWSTR
jgi:hypothetical protein